MGKESIENPIGYDETQAHNISSRQKENRGGTAGKVGEGESWEGEGCLEYRNRKLAAQVAGFVICWVPRLSFWKGWDSDECSLVRCSLRLHVPTIAPVKICALAAAGSRAVTH
jgi:hypothetical protein